MGRSVIVSADPDLNYLIFQKEGQLFQSWYPDTFTEIFGKQNVGSLHGFMYKHLKNMVLNLFGPENLKKLLPEVEEAASRNLARWSCMKNIDLKEATATVSYFRLPDYFLKCIFIDILCNNNINILFNSDHVYFLPGQMIFDLTAKKLISYDPEKSSENLRANFVAFMQGLISFHVDIPGTAYHKCLQVRKIQTNPPPPLPLSKYLL